MIRPRPLTAASCSRAVQLAMHTGLRGRGTGPCLQVLGVAALHPSDVGVCVVCGHVWVFGGRLLQSAPPWVLDNVDVGSLKKQHQYQTYNRELNCFMTDSGFETCFASSTVRSVRCLGAEHISNRRFGAIFEKGGVMS